MKLSSMLVISAALAVSQAAAAQDLNVFISPSGNDRHTGEQSDQAIRTLNKARARIVELSGEKSYSKINVNFLPGTYKGLGVIWKDVDLKGTPVYFKPAEKSNEPVIIDGTGGKFTRFFTVRATTGDSSQRVASNLHFEKLTIRNYCEGISLGDGLSKSILTGNSVTDSTFENIGSKYDPVSKEKDGTKLRNGSCTAAIRMQLSADNKIVGNTFKNIENLPKEQTYARRYGPTYLHALYIAHFSSGNIISNNTFDNFTGSPIRVRNRSDNVQIFKNTFSSPLYVEDEESRKRGTKKTIPAVSQWYCGRGLSACADGEVVHRAECPSVGLQMHDNATQGKIEAYTNLSAKSDSTCPKDDPTNATRFIKANQANIKNNVAR